MTITETHRSAKFRIGPITRWAMVSITLLISAFVLWLGWPAQAAELPSGTSQVEVYFIDDELVTPAATGERDGWFGRLSFPCDADSWYVESAGAAMCATIDGPHGKVSVSRENGTITLPAEAQKAINGWAGASGGTGGPTRALLIRDGDPAGIVTVAAPATAVPAH